MDYRLVLPPITGAVIGWLTNYVAIKLLFRPHDEVNVLGVRLQGAIPKRRKEIARSIASSIENELLSSDDIVSLLGSVDWKREVEKMVEDVVEHRLGSRRLRSIPVIGVVSDNVKYHTKYLLTREILRQVDAKKRGLAARIRDNIDIKDMLVSRIDALDVRRFEGLLTDFIAKELRYIERLGAVMGFVIGLFQSAFFYAAERFF
ncbi:MAG TPA: DUF445 family protein [Deltaproteobacteria bacterium]|nr:DUF445 family protein [Deltaproteobacteria bacterium]